MIRRFFKVLHALLIAILCFILLFNLWQITARALFHQKLPYIGGVPN